MAVEQKKTSGRGRKTNTTTTTTQKTVQENTDTELNKAKEENKQLTDMIAQMKAQMESMQQQINQNNSATNSVVIQQNDNMTRTVKVYSMLPFVYNLSTQPLGKGKVYSFTKFGESKSIKFSDMQDILVLFGDQFDKGYAILDSKQDYEDLGIAYLYDELLSKEQLNELIELTNDNAVDTILDMAEEMQQNIANIIAQKIADGVSYDYNKIKELEDNGLEINEIVELLKASTDKK